MDVSNTSLAILKKLRQNGRCSATKRTQQIVQLIENQKYNEITKHIRITQDVLNKIETLNHAIWSKLPEEEVEEDMTAAEESNERYREVIVEAEIQIQNFQNQRRESLTAPIRNETGDSRYRESSGINNDNQFSRLPHLSLPTFGGDPSEWPSFWQSFDQTVHTNGNVPTISKHHYLRQSLKGDAERSVRGIAVLRETYEETLDVLKSNFGKNRIVVDKLCKRIIHLKEVKDNQDILRFNLELTAVIRTLRAINVPDHRHETMTISIIHSKINEVLSKKWIDRFWKEDELELTQVLELLEEEGHRIREEVERNNRSFVDPVKTKYDSNLLIDVPPLRCFICENKGHGVTDCPLSVFEKRDMVRKKRLCYNCLRPGHHVKACRNKYSCKKCTKRHHSTLCQSPEESRTPIEQTELQFTKSEIVQNYSIDERGNTTPNTIEVELVDGRKLFVLFDSGSSRTFIRRSALEKLNYHHLYDENITVSGFLDKRSALQEVPVVECKIETVKPSSNITIEATVLERIGSLNSKRSEEVHLDKGRREIDIEVGIDLYWDIVLLKKPRRLSSNLVEMQTLWGPLVSGKSKMREQTHCHMTEIIKDLKMCHSRPRNETTKETVTKLIISTDGNSRIVASLPFKNEDRPIKNWSQCLRRMKKFFFTKMEILPYITNEFRTMEANGILEKARELHYILPYFTVNNHKKIRIVYDASFGQQSLNDTLADGNMRYPRIESIIMRSRLYESVLLADINKAFLQIGIEEQHRKFLQVAVPSGNSWEFYQFRRLPFGLNCGPSIFSQSLKFIISQEICENPCTTSGFNIEQLERNTYMDDFLFVNETAERRDRNFEIVSSILNKFHFQWSRIRRCEAKEESSILGVTWTENDEYKINIPKIPKIETKRCLLRFAASIYDPIGVTSPWLTRMRNIIRKCWNSHMKWDDALSEELKNEWEKLKEELRLFSSISIPRYIWTEDIEYIHIFVDASKWAIGVVVYLSSQSSSFFLYSRSKLTSQSKNITVQRSELEAILFGCQISEMISNSSDRLKSRKMVLWSDSKDNLMRIKNGKSFKCQYVENRVKQIRKYSLSLRFCEGAENPADVPSRIDIITERSLRKFLHPPEWLLREENWTKDISEEYCHLQDPIMEENENRSLIVTAKQDRNEIIEYMVGKYNCWIKLCSVMRWIQNAVNIFKKVEDRMSFCQAAKFVIEYEQGKYLRTERLRLKKELPIQKSSPFYGERIILVGRLIKMRIRSLRNSNSHVIIIPKQSIIVRIIIRTIHERNYHCGTQQTMFLFRMQFFTHSIRKTVKSIIKQCRHCHRNKIQPYCQIEGPLPEFREKMITPFRTIGIDYAGPFATVDIPKAYVLLITCATCRGVYLEVTSSQDATATIQSMKKFMCRFGVPSTIISDNGPSFVKSKRMLRNTLVGNSVGVYGWETKVDWKMNPPRAPWWGGMFERLIGLMKRHIRFRVEKNPMSFNTFQTMIVEIESLMNRRPLSAVQLSSGELSSISPFDLFRPYSFSPELKDRTIFMIARNQFRTFQNNQNHLVQMYIDELKYYKKDNGHTTECDLKQDDVVLIADDNNRKTWPLGIIEKTVKGQDGKIRLVFVRTVHGKETMIKRRAIQNICLLERAECREFTYIENID